jgi:DNA damage-inducible protein 1
MVPLPPQSAANNPTVLNPDGSAVNPQAFMDMISAVPGTMSQLPPTLTEAIKSKDISKVQQALKDLHQAKRRAEEEETRFLKLAAEDPFNPEVQRRLEQSIQERNIQQNMETAMEYHPEMFGSVHMLYVNMEVNGVAVKAFVDSGAQMTIMSKKCAEYCGVLRLMDTRWQGMAVGVGTTKIVGRIHLAPLRAGGVHFPSSITVLDDDKMPFLLGLDNLKAHQTCIDLKDNVLRFGSRGIVLPFLAEHEIPKAERFDAQQGGEGGIGDGNGGAGDQPRTITSEAPKQQQQQQQQPPIHEGSVVPEGWEEKVARLMGLGFDREQCLNALKATGGNEDAAGSLLFG